MGLSAHRPRRQARARAERVRACAYTAGPAQRQEGAGSSSIAHHAWRVRAAGTWTPTCVGRAFDRGASARGLRHDLRVMAGNWRPAKDTTERHAWVVTTS